MTEHDEILALHRQLAAEKLRANLAEARAMAKSRECIELRERLATRAPIPMTPEQAIGFIGDQFESREDAAEPDRVRYQLTVHDLLSAFRWWFDEGAVMPEILVLSESGVELAIERRDDGKWQFLPVSVEFERPRVTVTEKGPWQVSDWGRGRIALQSDDFTHDAALELSGDFGTPEQKRAHADEIVRRLNAAPTEQYTCIGKGGTYDKLGIATGAGTQRGIRLMVYRQAQTGELYVRDLADFAQRMERIGATV